MKSKILTIIFILSFNLNLHSNEALIENEIYKNLRCLVCQGQSVADSNSDFALTLKLVVKDLISKEKTEEEIYDFLSEKYGDWILYNPKFNLGNFLLWSLPYIVFVIGGIIIALFIKKQSKKT